MLSSIGYVRRFLTRCRDLGFSKAALWFAQRRLDIRTRTSVEDVSRSSEVAAILEFVNRSNISCFAFLAMFCVERHGTAHAAGRHQGTCTAVSERCRCRCRLWLLWMLGWKGARVRVGSPCLGRSLQCGFGVLDAGL